MDWSALFAAAGLISALGTAIVGGYARSVREDLKELQHDLTEHKVQSAEKYVTSDDLKDIKGSLRRIEEILHTKADK